MSQYTFSVRGSSRPIAPLTMDLPDASAAAAESVRYAGMALDGSPGTFLRDDEWMVDATDASGLLLVTISISLTRSPAMQRGSA